MAKIRTGVSELPNIYYTGVDAPHFCVAIVLMLVSGVRSTVFGWKNQLAILVVFIIFGIG